MAVEQTVNFFLHQWHAGLAPSIFLQTLQNGAISVKLEVTVALPKNISSSTAPNSQHNCNRSGKSSRQRRKNARKKLREENCTTAEVFYDSNESSQSFAYLLPKNETAVELEEHSTNTNACSEEISLYPASSSRQYNSTQPSIVPLQNQYVQNELSHVNQDYLQLAVNSDVHVSAQVKKGNYAGFVKRNLVHWRTSRNTWNAIALSAITALTTSRTVYGFPKLKQTLPTS